MSKAAGTPRAACSLLPTLVSRPTRPLSVSQQRALDTIVGLGAKLVTGFTAGELRSAYRMLARRYHPDRHPDKNQIEKSRLAGVFADLNENHQRLLTVLREPAEH